ncbi:hypothetical protein ACFXJ8_26185 [Nonomuraea sp. NPDC059194]|uniref:hypothetical protein n=1 Tax=Nonomuraea sp. NPDC059194 TaxID=3346764 RepID=UPI0036CD858B
MKVRAVAFKCDNPGCAARCQTTVRDFAAADRIARDVYGWTLVGGLEFCGDPCARAVGMAG